MAFLLNFRSKLNSYKWANLDLLGTHQRPSKDNLPCPIALTNINNINFQSFF